MLASLLPFGFWWLSGHPRSGQRTWCSKRPGHGGRRRFPLAGVFLGGLWRPWAEPTLTAGRQQQSVGFLPSFGSITGIRLCCEKKAIVFHSISFVLNLYRNYARCKGRHQYPFCQTKSFSIILSNKLWQLSSRPLIWYVMKQVYYYSCYNHKKILFMPKQ